MLLVAEDEGRFHACLPVRVTELRKNLPRAVVSSWWHPYCFLGTPLVAPERPVEALRSLLATLRGGGAGGKVVVLELFGDDGPVASYLRLAVEELRLCVRTHSSGERAVLRSGDRGSDALPANIKRERRAKARQWRRLCGDCGAPTVVDRAGDHDGATTFLAMEARGWKGKAGTALASRANHAAFYHEVTARFGAAGRLHLYSLEVGDKALAMQTNFCAGHALFDWKVAYDEQFAQYSPGTQLQLRVLDLARAENLHLVDSCADVGNDHQLRLLPGRRRIATLLIGGRGALSRAPLTVVSLLLVARNHRRMLMPGAVNSKVRQSLQVGRRLMCP